MYVIVRTDISPAQQMVQACHAALEAGFAFKAPGETASLILLAVSNRADLEAAAARLQFHGICHQLFFEPDWDLGHSALATRPLHLPEERRILKKYRLHAGFAALAGAA